LVRGKAIKPLYSVGFDWYGSLNDEQLPYEFGIERAWKFKNSGF
jgi:hypothetical protein